MSIFDKFGLVNNPITKAVGAGLLTAAGIAATTAFAPMGVVGATGWVVVYLVSGGTFSWEALKAYRNFSSEDKAKFDIEIKKLKTLLDNDVISKEEFNRRTKDLYNRMKAWFYFFTHKVR